MFGDMIAQKLNGQKYVYPSGVFSSWASNANKIIRQECGSGFELNTLSAYPFAKASTSTTTATKTLTTTRNITKFFELYVEI